MGLYYFWPINWIRPTSAYHYPSYTKPSPLGLIFKSSITVYIFILLHICLSVRPKTLFTRIPFASSNPSILKVFLSTLTVLAFFSPSKCSYYYSFLFHSCFICLVPSIQWIDWIRLHLFICVCVCVMEFHFFASILLRGQVSIFF